MTDPEEPIAAIPWEVATAFQRARLAYDDTCERSKIETLQFAEDQTLDNYIRAVRAIEDERQAASSLRKAEDLVLTYSLPNLTDPQVHMINVGRNVSPTRVEQATELLEKMRAIGRDLGWE